jgi:hypothetical protein
LISSHKQPPSMQIKHQAWHVFADPVAPARNCPRGGETALSRPDDGDRNA